MPLEQTNPQNNTMNFDVNQFDNINLFDQFTKAAGTETEEEKKAKTAAATTAAAATAAAATPDTRKQNEGRAGNLISKFLQTGKNEDGSAGSGSQLISELEKSAANDKSPLPTAAVEKTDSQAAILYNHYVEKGILEKYESFDNTEEGLTAAIDNTVQARLDSALDQHINEIFSKSGQGELVKAFLTHVSRGGKISDFQANNEDRDLDMTQLDSKDDTTAINAAKSVLEAYFTELGLPKAKVLAQLQIFEALGRDHIVEQAKSFGEEYLKIKTDKRTQQAQQLLAQDTATKAKQRQFNESLLKMINETPEMLGVKFETKAQRDEYARYMFAPTVELQDGRRVPQFFVDQAQRANSPEYALAKAVLLKNNLKLSDVLTKGAASAAAQTLEEKLGNIQKNKSIAGSNNAQNAGSSNTDTPKIPKFEEMDVVIM